MVCLRRSASALVLVSTFLALGCRAQTPPASKPVTSSAVAVAATATPPLPTDLERRVEVTLRLKAPLPPGSTVNIGGRTPSEFPGYSRIAVSITSIEGETSRPISFLLSDDGKTLAQMTKFDISPDPKSIVSADKRPWRGGPVNAPVTIVGFDDLECPYCARLHAEIFPALTARYRDQVRVVYRDFPLDQHPWAMRAAVDTNCLAAQSNTGYWNAVDYIHLHAGEIGATAEKPDDKTLPRANEQLDKLVHEQAEFQKVDAAKVDACVKAQDTKGIEASKQMGTALGVDSTPALFINGDKIDGAVPLEFLYKIIDQALVAAGQVPPAPYVAPKTADASAVSGASSGPSSR